jgi:hypothetical protein
MAWLERSLIGTGISVTVWQGSWRLLLMDIFVSQRRVFQCSLFSSGYFGDCVAGELEAFIDGHLCVAKTGLPVQLIFKRNHASFENNPAAK